jgi:hypothetical protein
MRKTFLFLTALIIGFAVVAQNQSLKSNLKAEKPIFEKMLSMEPQNPNVVGESHKANTPAAYKNTDAVTVISIGTSANAYGYGYAGGQKNLVAVNNELNTVTNIHRMGGDLDPGGYSGDLGYDASFDGGLTWNNMVECYVATENAGGEYFLDAARYPNHGIYNPIGNTDPNEAYLTFFAPNIDLSNDPAGWGGYSYGIHKMGSPANVDTTKHLRSSRPADGIYQEIPDGYCVTSLGDVWVADLNKNWSSGALVYEGNMIINHGTWDETEMDFVYEEILIDCPVQPASTLPAFQQIEFAPDGLTGYILVLADNGEVEISKDMSYYPIIWRTEDGGETWSDAIPVAIAGEDGIAQVQNYLSDEEIAELFLEPLPDRDEIPFTTSFDCDLSVDANGNPALAVVIGVTGADPYSILTGISPSSGFAFTSAFLLHSVDKGEEGSWFGHEMGRPVSFRGNFGDLTEDNRIQIARTPAGDKMFVSWLDTDTTVSAENNAPDIWARGINLTENTLTRDENGEAMPTNVTFGSEATFSAYFFAMGNEVFDDGNGNYTIPYVYENMTPTDPAQPVQYKYIQDFMYTDADFLYVGMEESEMAGSDFAIVSQTMPNPAVTSANFNVTLTETTNVSVHVTNLMGQNVMSLPVRTMQAGANPVSIDVTGLTSGVYFYTVEAGNKAITRKMVVK